MLGGGLVAKIGLRRSLLAFGILQTATNSGYLALALAGKNHALLVGAIAIDLFCGGLAAAAFSAFMLSLCNKSFSATQFALLASAATIAGRLVSASSGYMANAWGWPTFFALTMVVALPALLLVPFLPRDQPTEPATAHAA
jgi:MFS transporter, PAT family, beta-lactamase induction signal transducer AmpG